MKEHLEVSSSLEGTRDHKNKLAEEKKRDER
jgi:hypothetical protein